jgi:hypothetical protein
VLIFWIFELGNAAGGLPFRNSKIQMPGRPRAFDLGKSLPGCCVADDQ